MRVAGLLVVGLLVAGCGGTPGGEGGGRPAAPAVEPSTTTSEATAATAAAPTAPGVPPSIAPAPTPAPLSRVPTPRRPASTTTLAAPPVETVTIEYVLDRRTGDEATADFVASAEATLSDPRGWSRARYRFVRGGEDAPYRIVLAEGDEVDRLCLPYDTYGEYSCQNGPVVALNADRWRTATPKWTGDLETYRRMLVNHEVGHLLGLRHPRPQCPRRGTPAPIMNQQSTELNGCLPNPWPLDDEIATAARHDRKLAPGPGE